MTEFCADVKKMREQADKLSSYAVFFEKKANSVQKTTQYMSGMQGAARGLLTQVTQLSKNISNIENDVFAYAKCLNDVVNCYTETERLLSSNLVATPNSDGTETASGKKRGSWYSGLVNWVQNLFPKKKNYYVDVNKSIVFDEIGEYGGDQGGPEYATGKEREQLYKLVRKYYPNMSDGEIALFLHKLNTEGCGYVAIINTIFASYQGREAEFKKTFGFSMYGANGDLNYNRLLLDFYLATDNRNAWGYDSYEDPSDEKGKGTDCYSRKYRTHLYLDSKNVHVSIKNDVEVTKDNFSDFNKGYIIVSYHNGNLYRADGSIAQYIDGGHAMVITGVTQDGRYVVSSWGEQYFLDPGDGEYYDFSYYVY